jgi:hypothetical protein
MEKAVIAAMKTSGSHLRISPPCADEIEQLFDGVLENGQVEFVAPRRFACR